MQDCFGTELKVGDMVTYPEFFRNSRGTITSSKMCKGRITKIFNKMIEIGGKRRSVKYVVKVGE